MNVRPTTMIIASGLVVIAVLGLVFLYSAVIQPQKEAIRLTKEQIQLQESLIKEYQSRQKEGSGSANWIAIKNELPKTFSMGEFLQHMDRAQESSDCAIIDVTFAEKHADGKKDSNRTEKQEGARPLSRGIKKLTARLTVKSPGFTEMIEFLENMKMPAGVITVDSLAFSKSSGDAVTFSVEISAFYAPGEEPENRSA